MRSTQTQITRHQDILDERLPGDPVRRLLLHHLHWAVAPEIAVQVFSRTRLLLVLLLLLQ